MAWVRPVRPVQFVDGFKTLQKEDNHVTTTFQLKPHVSPITKSFFQFNVNIIKNIIFSDIGILAKHATGRILFT